MNKATRILAMAGLALTAGAAFSATPAMASPITPAASAQSAGHHVQTMGGNRLVGFFRTKRACETVGRNGEHRNRWNDFSCAAVHAGKHRGTFALRVHTGDSHQSKAGNQQMPGHMNPGHMNPGHHLTSKHSMVNHSNAAH